MSISITYEGKDVPVTHLQVHESFDLLSSELTLGSIELLPPTITFTSEDVFTASLIQVAGGYTKDGYYTTYIPESVHKALLSDSYGPYEGFISVEELCSNMGLTVRSDFSSDAVYWCLRRTNLFNFLKSIEDAAGTLGLLYSFDLTGELVLLNLRNSAMVEHKAYTGRVTEIGYDIRNIYTSPSMVKFNYTSHEVSDSVVDLNIASHYGRANSYSVGDVDINERIVTNRYYKNLFTSSKRIIKEFLSEYINLGVFVSDEGPWFVYDLVFNGKTTDVVLCSSIGKY